MTYFDTSALVKRFVLEAGSETVQRLILRGRPIASATIAYAETYSRLTRRHREGALSPREYRSVCQRFERDWMEVLKVELRVEVLMSARALIQRHGIRAFDAIHLASALGLQAAADEPVAFVASDDRLLRAATAEHLDTVNPETDSAPPRRAR